jgi:hypothetical protein|nr:MAG TPA: hypothetical protein [Siphoviridae sp. ctRJB2]
MDTRGFLAIRLFVYFIVMMIVGLFLQYSDIGVALMTFAVFLGLWVVSIELREYSDSLIEERWKIFRPGIVEIILIVLFAGWFAFISSLHFEHKRPEQIEQEYQNRCKQLYGTEAGVFTERRRSSIYRYCYDPDGNIKVLH